MPPSPPPPAGNAAAIDRFIAYWQGQEGGQERANYQLFLIGLAEALGMPRPDAAGPNTDANQYVFERAVTFREPDGTTSTGRIDLYRRGSFVLEAKQSRQKGQAKAIPGQSDLFVPESEPRGERGATRAWDVLMLNARRQAEDYAKALPTSDGWPPFLLICDVGHCIEVFADFSGQGKNYSHFPDRNSYRIYLEDLRTADTQDRLRLIWNDPQKLDPAKRSAKVTREIAERLAEVSKALEKRDFPAEDVALFLMRCLFTMFAEDVELLPKASFKDLLERCAKDEKKFAPMVEQLWQAMDVGDFAFGIETKVPRFNGKLFKAAKALPLRREEIGELLVAAKADWKQVEPAIFGTLLEQALDVKERARLGAHYTPRAFVERLVVATVIEPLRADWLVALATAERLNAEKKHAEARKVIGEFHSTLCQTRVLDPACGTGNFLYVALELMKRLEGEVLEAVVSLGGQEGLSWLDRQTVDPHQFLGIEKNPRAAAIAELVVWLGYLQWHFRTRSDAPPEPILRDFKNIEARDAVLDWDGAPLPQVSRVDGRTIETYPNARRPKWWSRSEDEPTFIVGNPPFIGGKDLRANLGDAYTEALWSVHDDINESADFVMYWWDRAAEIVARKGSVTRRFGFVTTNSITQVFSRRVIERHLGAKQPISLLMAIADHPWTKLTGKDAAVRIAMTVCAAGRHDGVVRQVVEEVGLNTDQPTIEFTDAAGSINADLTVGADVTRAMDLRANKGLAFLGYKLHGQGFVIESDVFAKWNAKYGDRIAKVVKPYRIGRDLVQSARQRFVIDFYPMTQDEARTSFPEAYQTVLEKVKPERDQNREQFRRDNWWWFGRTHENQRAATEVVRRYISTTRTAKHRIFVFVEPDLIAESTIVMIASEDAADLGYLSSRIHEVWSLRSGGWLGVGNDPRYMHDRCFDPFPFPTPDRDTAAEIRAIAEELDKHRKDRQAEHAGLTLTDMYNVLEKLRSGVALDDDDRRIKDQGLVLMLKEYHDRLDAAVARAYGWPIDLTDEQILERLVALNAERAEEEKSGRVRWLRPDYQIPRFGSAAEKARWQREQAGEHADADDVNPAQGEMLMAGGTSAIAAPADDDAAKPKFPTNDEMAETAAVMTALLASAKPMTPTEVARHFKGGKQNERRVKLVLDALSRLGHLSSADGGESFALRRGG
jgi:hypothetical protein